MLITQTIVKYYVKVNLQSPNDYISQKYCQTCGHSAKDKNIYLEFWFKMSRVDLIKHLCNCTTQQFIRNYLNNWTSITVIHFCIIILFFQTMKLHHCIPLKQTAFLYIIIILVHILFGVLCFIAVMRSALLALFRWWMEWWISINCMQT